MNDYQPNHSEFSPLAVAVHFCFYPDGVTFGLNSDCSLFGLVALTKLISIPDIRGNFPPYSLSRGQWGHYRNMGQIAEASKYSTGSSKTHISKDSWLMDRVLLCYKKICCLVKIRLWAMAKVDGWNIWSTHPLIGREVFNMTCCSFVRGTTWRHTL